jgi:hypothetical protein
LARATGARASAAIALATVAVLACVVPVSARTVLLVYDDSGSMRDFDRHVFANYAMQNLVALLDPGDRLEVVRMSLRDRWVTLLPETNPRTAIEAVAAWPTPGATPTPYEAVQTATARLKSLRAEGDDDDTDYWLIVVSDGEFNEFEANATRELSTIRSEVEELSRHFAGRKLGVLYLGIGPDAQDYARAWEAAGVTTFLARTSESIIDAMFDIAALVTGRDPESGESASGLRARFPGDGTIEVVTELPLRRLVVFHQGSEPLSLRVDQARSRIVDASGTSTPVSVGPPLSARRGPLFSVVNVVSGERLFQVMGPGTFSLALEADRIVLPAALRFLPDVALSLEVESQTSRARTCAGETVTLLARLSDPGTGASVDLTRLAGLEVSAQMQADSGTSTFAFRQLDPTTYAADLAIVPGRSVVSVTARFPGYFNLRSRLFTFDGEACATGITVETGATLLTVPAAFHADMREVARTSISISPTQPIPATEATFEVAARGLPSGVSLEFAGRTLAAELVRVGVPLGRPVPIIVRGNEGFTSRRAPVTMTLVPVDGAILAPPVSIELEFLLDPVRLRVTPSSLGPVELAPTLATEFRRAFEGVVSIEATAPAGGMLPPAAAFGVAASGLGTGLQVRLADARLEASAPGASVTIPLNAPNAVEVWFREGVPAAGPGEAYLRFTSPDARFEWTAPDLQLAFGVAARSLALLTDATWRVALDDLPDAGAFAVRALANQGAVPPEELARWTVEATVPSRLGVDTSIDTEGGRVLVRPRPARWALFTRTGSVEVEVRAVTPFGETVVERFPLTVVDMPFLRRWGLPILYLLAAAVAVWLVVAYLRKPKFPRGAAIQVFEVIRLSSEARVRWVGTGTAPRERREHKRNVLLARASVGTSRVSPLGPQRALVEGFRFRAIGGGAIELEPEPESRQAIRSDGPVLKSGAGLPIDRRKPHTLIPMTLGGKAKQSGTARSMVFEALDTDVNDGKMVRREYVFVSGLHSN